MTDDRTHTDPEREMLTLMEAAAILRIGRTTAYELAHEFLRTYGAAGLPVIRVGKQLRVQRSQLDEVIQHGTGDLRATRPVAPTQRSTKPAQSPREQGDVLQLFS